MRKIESRIIYFKKALAVLLLAMLARSCFRLARLARARWPAHRFAQSLGFASENGAKNFTETRLLVPRRSAPTPKLRNSKSFSINLTPIKNYFRHALRGRRQGQPPLFLFLWRAVGARSPRAQAIPPRASHRTPCLTVRGLASSSLRSSPLTAQGACL